MGAWAFGQAFPGPLLVFDVVWLSWSYPRLRCWPGYQSSLLVLWERGPGIHTSHWHPPQISVPCTLHPMASQPYPRPTSGLLVLSAPLCTLWGLDREPQQLAQHHVGVWLLNFQLPPSSTVANPLSWVSIQISNQKLKHSPPLLLTSLFKFSDVCEGSCL